MLSMFHVQNSAHKIHSATIRARSSVGVGQFLIESIPCAIYTQFVRGCRLAVHRVLASNKGVECKPTVCGVASKEI